MIKNQQRQSNLDHLRYLFLNFGLKNQVFQFLENFSLLLDSGMGVGEAFKSLAFEEEIPRLRKRLEVMSKDIDQGVGLTKVFENHRMIGGHSLALMRLGEETGRLREVLRLIVLQNKKSDALRSRVRSSLLYGVIILSLTFIVGVGTAWYTLPRLADFFLTFGQDLPLITRLMIDAGIFLEMYGVFVIPLIIVFLVVVLYFLFSFPRTKFIGHSILFHVPVIKKLIQYSEISRFGFIFGTQLESGMNIMQALRNMSDTTTFLNYKAFYVHMAYVVEEGGTFDDAFKTYPKAPKLFPYSSRQMIGAAERSGSLSKTLITIGEMYEEKTQSLARDLPVVIEPILMVIVASGVALFALGTIMPIYNLSEIF